MRLRVIGQPLAGRGLGRLIQFVLGDVQRHCLVEPFVEAVISLEKFVDDNGHHQQQGDGQH